VCSDQCAFADFDPRQDDRHRRHGYESAQGDTAHYLAGWMRVIGQHDVWKDPDEVFDRGVLADVHVAVQSDEIADSAGALNVA
jgi:hypothetical protein